MRHTLSLNWLPVCVCLFVASQSTIGQEVEYRFINIDFPGATSTIANRINNAGAVVGYYGEIDFADTSVDGVKGFLLQDGEFETIEVPSSTFTNALGISNSGTIVGAYRSEDITRGYVFDGESFSEIFVQGSEATVAHDINDDGIIVGSYILNGFLHGFWFDGETYNLFNVTESLLTEFVGVNGSSTRLGYTAVGEPIPRLMGFLGDDEFRIAHPTQVTQNVTDINDDGLVVGNLISTATFFRDGFVYDIEQESYVDISLPGPPCVVGGCFRGLQGINSQLTIVGYFDNNDGIYQGFIGEVDGDSPGDFNRDNNLTADDIDLLTDEVRRGSNQSIFDLNGDMLVNNDDRRIWVDELKQTFFGDSNLDSEFNSADLVSVFVADEFEDTVVGNSRWTTGDWNGDGDFLSDDFVLAFQAGGYEKGPRRVAATVPEPMTYSLLLIYLPFAVFFLRGPKSTLTRVRQF